MPNCKELFAMKKKRFLLSALFAICLVGAASARDMFELRLWRGSSVRGDANTARLYCYIPDNLKNGTAVIVCPGGAYSGLAIDYEGHSFAQWLEDNGIAAFVLKYRMPAGRNAIPLADAEQAVSVVRSRAKEWGINTHKVGIMGSSAGGHLASTLATHYGSEDTRPDFQILNYPVITMDKSYTHMGSHDNLLGSSASGELEDEYSNEKHVTASTPECFIAVSAADEIVPVKNSLAYTQALIDNGVPVSLHVYPGGFHGWGNKADFKDHVIYQTELMNWLQTEIVAAEMPEGDALVRHFDGDSCQLSSNCNMPLDYRSVNGKDYGTTMANLGDGDHEHTIFHSRFDWPQSGITGLNLHAQDLWIQVDLQRSDISSFQYEYWGIVNNSAYDNPTDVVIEATNTPSDESSWRQVAEDKPAAVNESNFHYVSPAINMGAAYRYLRFVVKETVTGNNYFNISELQLYSVDETTGVEQAKAAAVDSADVYDVEGRLVRRGTDAADATKGLPSGIYIVGGRKVAVK